MESLEIGITKFGLYLNYLWILEAYWKKKKEKGLNLIMHAGEI